MRIAVTGATGLIGRALTARLVSAGHDLAAFSRNPEHARRLLPSRARILPWKPQDLGETASALAGVEAIVNLAGESLGSGRWTEAKKKAILNSRVHAGTSLALALTQLEARPRIFIQASAVGFYGNAGDAEADETTPCGEGFLSHIVRAWEGSVSDIPDLGARLVILRLGMVLDAGGGALARMVRPFKFYLGGVPGDGKAWVSWVHMRDVVSAFQWALENGAAEGLYNVTAPETLRASEFYPMVARTLKRPCKFPQPPWLLRLIFGEMADELMLKGRRVRSDKIRAAGFSFSHPKAGEALKELLAKGGSRSL